MSRDVQTEQALEARYMTMYEGMIEKDRATLDDVLAPSFMLTHMTGMRQDKEQFISAVLDGTLNYFQVSHESIKADVDSDDATLVGDSLVEAAVFGGSRATWRLRLAIQATKEDGTWRFTAAKASVY